MAVVMGTPFDRVECPTATLGIGTVVVTDPSPRFMRPYDAGVRDGDPVTLLLEEGSDFELAEATAQNCSAQRCEFTRDTVRYSSIGGVIGKAKLPLKGAARVSIVAGAADLNVHRGGTITGDIILDGDLSVSGILTAPGLEAPPGPQGPPGPAGADSTVPGPQGPPGNTGAPGPEGPAGAPGPKGDTGIAGVAGPKGDKGDAGATGPQGPKGDKGDAGAPGASGATGPQGSVGPAGPNAVSANAGNQARLGTDSLIFVPAPTAVKGVSDGSNAAAGIVGEVIAAGTPAGLSLTTNIPTNLITLHLTPGDWTVASVTTFTPSSTGPNGLASGITLTSGTLPTDAEITSGVGILNQLWSSSMPSNKIQNIPTSMVRVNTAVPKDVYLVVMASFGGGTVTATGYMSARRVR